MALISRQLDVRLHEGGVHVGDAYVNGLSLTIYQCGLCGVMHGLTDNFIEARKRDHKSFCCPWCQASLHFGGESDLERLQRERDQAKEMRDDAVARARASRELLRHEERSHAATKGHLTRTKKERDRMHAMIDAGQCPVPGCRRHFKDVKRHMASKHPNFVLEG